VILLKKSKIERGGEKIRASSGRHMESQQRPIKLKKRFPPLRR
jgi:hypothetical protein